MYGPPVAATAFISEDIIQRDNRLHEGVDIASPLSIDKPAIIAIDAGKVVFADENNWGFGKFVVVEHAGVHSLYGHLDSIAVKESQRVDQGDTLGIMGNTGASEGRHVHLEMFIASGAWESAFPSPDPEGTRWRCRKNPILEIEALGGAIPYRGDRSPIERQKRKAFEDWVRAIADLHKMKSQDVVDELLKAGLVDPKWLPPAAFPSA